MFLTLLVRSLEGHLPTKKCMPHVYESSFPEQLEVENRERERNGESRVTN